MPELADALRNIFQRLLDVGIEEHEARREAVMIVQHATGHSPTMQHLHFDELVTEETMLDIESIVSQRERRVPLQYCLGEAWFMGLRLAVEPGVLIPRADTETLVEISLGLLSTKSNDLLFADIGCGSGAIVVAMLQSMRRARAFAIDISSIAAEVTRKNAAAHGVGDRLEIICDDWMNFRPERQLDALISNPPYIPRRLGAELAPEVAVFEPEIALYGQDEDGLGFYRQLNRHAGQLLLPDGLMALEVGQGQAESVVALLQSGPWNSVAVHSDLSGISRVVTAFRAVPSY